MRVVFGKKRHIRPPPANRTATMNVGAGQYVSNNVAITTFPIIPPRRAATIEIATPVALFYFKQKNTIKYLISVYLKSIITLNWLEILQL